MKARNVNFRQTHSERSATRSYKNFGKFIKEKFQKIRTKKYKQSLNFFSSKLSKKYGKS